MQNVLNKVRESQVNELKQNLELKQCGHGYIKLPVVPKKFVRGPKGALFYLNQRNNKVYPNSFAKQRLYAGTTTGVVNPEVIHDVNAEWNVVPQTVFQRIDRTLRQAAQL